MDKSNEKILSTSGRGRPVTHFKLNENTKRQIDQSVKRTVKEYEKTLRLLGQE